MLKKVNPFLVVVCLLLVVLVSCSQVSEFDVGVDNDILGTATLNFSAGDDPLTVESQALVNGIGFNVLGRTVIDFDGERYMSLSLEVVNGSGQNLDNLNLIAIARDYTVAGTALTGVRDAAGNTITNPDVVRAVRPAHTVMLRNGQLQQVPEESDFQGYLPAEVAQVQVDADAVADDITVLEYGYVARNMNGTRAIPAGESGMVSFTVRFPFDPDAPLGSPFRFSLTVAIVNSSTTRFTRGLNETSQNFQNRIEVYYAPNPVPATIELLLVGEPSTPLTIGTTLTTPDLQRFVDTPTTTLPTFNDALGMVVRVDRENRQLAAAFVDDDNRGSRFRAVPQASTQYFIEDAVVTEDTFWQQLKDVPEFVFSSDTVVVSGQQINDVIVVADRLELTNVYDYRMLSDSFLYRTITDVIVNSALNVDIDIEICTNLNSVLSYEFSRVMQVRSSNEFLLDITLRIDEGQSLGITLPGVPPPCITSSIFTIPLELNEALSSGNYGVIVKGINNNQPVSFVIP